MSVKTFDQFLQETFDGEFIAEADREYAQLQIAARALEVAEASGLSRREIARRMGLSSPSSVQRLVDPDRAHNATVDSLMRFAHACGCRLVVSFEPDGRAASRSPAPPVLGLEEYARRRRTSWTAETSAHVHTLAS